MALRKIIASLLVSAIVTAQFPTITFADTIDHEVDVNLNVTSENATTTVTTNEDNVDIKVDVDLTNRTISLLDIAKFVNTSNTLKQDYKTNIKDRLVELAPEYEYADIVEYEGFDTNYREKITVDNKASQEYASKVEYLINKNILNRTTYFMYDKAGVYSSQLRSSNPSGSSLKSEQENQEHKYYKPSDKVSKTDFIVDLMKTEKVEESRPILVQTPYTRMDTNFNKSNIITEPIETSPYTSELGRLGLDFASQDIIASHVAFNQTDVLVTNDVVEYYLMNALNKNIISESEIGGTEGNLFIESISSNTKNNNGYLLQNSPIRQFYSTDPLSNKLNGKIFEENIKYPALLDTYKEIKKSVLDVEETELGTLPPWGFSYSYNADNYCIFANTYNQQPIEIVKRPSIVDVNSNKMNTNLKGYEYFNEENITLTDAYMITHNFLLANGDEDKLTDTEIQYLNSAYSLNFTSFTEEERKATEYLIAKGIVDAGDKDLYLASSKQLTWEDALDIIYRVENKDARIEFTPMLTDLDKDMATRGFSQVKVEVTSENQGGNYEVITDNSLDGVIKVTNKDGTVTTYDNYKDYQTKNRASNPASYDMVYVRIPKELTDKINETNSGYIKLVTDDSARVVIDPYNDTRLNGGVTNGGSTNEPSLLADEDIYTSEYVFKDKEGYSWYRYLIHKDISSNVILTSFTANGTSSYKGINGEGVYVIKDGTSSGNFTKLTFDESRTNSMTNRIYDQVIKHDILVRNAMSIASASPTERLIETNTRQQLWTQKNYMTEDKTGFTTLKIVINAEDIEFVTYNGTQMFSKAQNGTISLNPEVNMTQTARDSYDLTKIEIEKDSSGKPIRYLIPYTSPYQNYTSGRVDATLNLGHLGMSVKSNSNLVMPGYATIDNNGESIVLIQSNELEQFGIELKSEKMLYNKHTGQRAFINTTDNTVLIGNNITQYDDNQLLVTATGGGSDKVVFYNLEVVMGLLNDVSHVIKRAGTSVYAQISNDPTTTTEKYSSIEIADVLYGINGSNTIVDRTYIMSPDNFKSIYMNMSAISGTGSNYIYYKHKGKKLNLLLVYEPNIQVGITDDKYTDNSVLRSVSKGESNIINTSDKGNPSRDLVLTSLFGATDNSAVSSILNDNYNVTLNILAESKTVAQENLVSLIELVTGNNGDKYNTLLDGLVKVGGDLKVENFTPPIAKEIKEMPSTFTIDYIQSSGSTADKTSDFITHNNSGNLYYRLINNGVSNSNKLQQIIGTRFYLGTQTNKNATDAERNNYAKEIDNAVVSSKSPNTSEFDSHVAGEKLRKISDDSRQKRGIIKMRRGVFFENTPVGYIPLEQYALPKYRSYMAIKSSDGNTSNNFPKSAPYKLTNDLANEYDANIHIEKIDTKESKGSQDVGLATNLELDYRKIDNKVLYELLDKGKATPSYFLNQYYKHVVEVFNKEINDYNKSKGIKETYNIKAALGDASGDYIVKVGWSFNDLSDYTKTQFFSGMWRGIGNSQKSYYTLDKEKLDTGDNYILLIGESPEITVTRNDKTPIFYLAKVNGKDLGNINANKVDAISKYSDLPHKVRDALEGKRSDINIWYKPTIAIPAGTTLVASDGTLRLSLSKDGIRGEKYFQRDIINTTLAFAQEQDDLLYLYELKQGSKVLLTEGSAVYTTQTPKISVFSKDYNQETGEINGAKKLQWVPVITLPVSDSKKSSYLSVPKSSLSQYKILSDFGLQYSSVEIPLRLSMEDLGRNKNILLKDVVKTNSYRLPTKYEAEYFLNPSINKNNEHIQKDFAVGSMYTFNPIESKNLAQNSLEYDPYVLKYNEALKSVEETEDTTGHLSIVMSLPPSIQVEPVEGQSGVYRVKSYWDMNNFIVDDSGDMTAYMTARDTQVLSVQDILEQMRNVSSDGSHYKQYAVASYVYKLWERFIAILMYGIPTIIIILWLYLSVLYVILYFDRSREWLNRVSTRLGFNIIGRITFNVLSPNKEIPTLGRYAIISLALFVFLDLIWSNLIMTWILGFF